MAMLGTFLRPAKGRKPPLRAKWDHCFESLLDGPLDVSRQPRRWWDDFLLLGVNARLLADTILATPEDRLFAQRGVFSAVCATCLSYLDDENLLRVSHALEILILIHQGAAARQGAGRAAASRDDEKGGATAAALGPVGGAQGPAGGAQGPTSGVQGPLRAWAWPAWADGGSAQARAASGGTAHRRGAVRALL